jgi:uncharacterized membrane protein YgdD (TMEM256/DUF423 family)
MDERDSLFFVRAAAFMGATAVLLGAFAAHGLRDSLSDDMLAIFEVGVRYHMFHALAILAASLAPDIWWRRLRLRAACWAWIAGIMIFSGSLYLLAVTGAKWLGAVTPIGGVAFVAGWTLAAWRQKAVPNPRENA